MSNGDYPLRTLFWEATLRCNARCDFCGSGCGGSNAEEVEGALICQALRQVAEAYEPSGVMLNVTGGEPLLRPDLFSVMAYADRLGFPWGMVTNGSLLTDQVIRQMRETHMKTISISLDGPPEYHERVRHLPGGFSAIIRGLEKLQRADFLECVQITTVVTRQNLPYLEELYDFLQGQPIDSWRIAPVDPIGRGRERTDLLLGPEEQARLLVFLEEHSFCSHFAVTTSCSHYLGERDTLYRDHAFQCHAGRRVASILANGDFFVCPNVPRLPWLIQGNVRTDNLAEAWQKRYQWFREPENRRKGPCAACPSWERCKGDSLHTWNFERQAPEVCLGTLFPAVTKSAELPPALQAFVRGQLQAPRGVRFSYGSSSRKCVYWLPEAAEEFFHYFRWGRRHPANLCEQMAGLVGHVREDTAYIESVVPVYVENRSSTQASFTGESHRRMREELALMNRNLPDAEEDYRLFSGPYQLLGYVHSHPGELPGGLSQPDLQLRQLLQPSFPEVLLMGVANPQKRELCIYWDSAYSPVDTILLTEAAQVEQWLGRETARTSLDAHP